MKTGGGNQERLLNGSGVPAIIGEAGMKPYNFKEIGEDAIEVEMYGQVVENRPIDWRTGEPSKGLFIVLSEFLQDLDSYKDKRKITFRLNSVGGDLFAGISIYNRMTELEGDTVTIVDGLAASAASVILQGGKKRKVFAGSQVMVHGASVFMYGSYNQQELKKVEDRIEGGNRSILEVYAAKTGKEKGFLRGLMDKEEWMTGKEAIENGFADELVETGHVKLEMSADRKAVLANGIWMPMEGFRNIPVGIPVTGASSAITAVAIHGIMEKKETGGEEVMDMQGLREKYPELVQQIEQEARQEAGAEASGIKEESIRAERERLKEIEEIENQIVDKGLVAEAKFGENPMTAQELAFEAMRRQKGDGDCFMGKLMGDAESSGTKDVKAAPNKGVIGMEEEENEDIANGADLIAKAWK